MLNEFLFYVFSKNSSWQNMSLRDMTVTTLADVTDLNQNSTYQALPS